MFPKRMEMQLEREDDAIHLYEALLLVIPDPEESRLEVQNGRLAPQFNKRAYHTL